MSDTLTIGGAGSTSVAVDTLFADASRLARAEAVVQRWIERLDRIRTRSLHLADEASASGSLPWPEAEVRSAGERLVEVAARVSEARRALEQSAERYGWTERLVSALWDLGGELGARALGFVGPQALAGSLIAMLPLVLPAAVVFGLAHAFGAEPETAITGSTRRWLEQHRGILGDPAFVRLVRTSADHADDVLLAAMHVPGAAGVGRMIGAPESASLLLGAAGVLGLTTGRTLVDGPVGVARVSGARVGVAPSHQSAVAPPPTPGVAIPPSGYEDVAERIPRSDGTAQVAVERYSVDGENRWMVYIGGTVDFGIVAGAQPFDMTSNVHGIADDSPIDGIRPVGADSGAAERAVREALVAAGAEPDDPILAVGHSGGGVIAAGLAADPELNVVGGMNLGGPVASAQIPDGRAFISVEHEDDLVPATGGSGHASSVQVVSRRAVEPGYDGAVVLPAHQLVEYGRTMALMDESDDPRLTAFRARIVAFTGGTVGERTEWRAERE
ncbi:hypothetical protein SAMN05428970_0156 [Agromyces sp. CF514]|uniref:hypothetical protein n=1 Tax=Agromyces sp. CF514 TaxID=1881031 RepID=UPI0008E37699|nr:hypothetical protein [Agromyces sp. CF514]SFR67123.1 hypothetical protein SAMN05428970_0156 [Agromyces sp. CF514]